MNPYVIDQVLAELGSAQHGVFAGYQARQRGVSDEALEHRARGRWLVRLKKDIYRLRDHPWTWHAQLQAALLDAGPAAVVSHRAAAQLHGFWRYRKTCAVEIAGPQVHDHRVTLGRFHRTTLLPPGHCTVVGGFPVTSVARTCFDLIGDPDPGLRRSDQGRGIHAKIMGRVVNDALSQRGLTLGQLAAVRATLAGRGRSGSVLIRDLMQLMGPDYVPPASDGESLLLELVHDFGLLEPERQVALSDEQGWIGNVDTLWRPAMLIVEVDSVWHDGPLDRAADLERDRRLQALGYDVWRVRYNELILETNRFMRRLARRLILGS